LDAPPSNGYKPTLNRGRLEGVKSTWAAGLAGTMTEENGMNGPDHYREAERLLNEATSRGDFNPRAQWCLELAKLHTALAHVAATAQASDSREWVRIAGPWFSDLSLALHEQG
jgi:hypothetical protein